tara:strand:+ start:3096 stop:3866 length:771 start_codon:yes stop_codon:yes gene_type:complete
MDLLPISEQQDYLRVLVYGPPDAGKTTLGCSGSGHPEFSPTVVANIEDGLQSVRWNGAGLLRTPKIETPEDIERVILAAASGAGAFADCKCLVLDSLTKMAKILLHGIVAKKHAKKPRRGGVDQIELSDYGDLGKAMERYFDLLSSLDMHIVFIALEKEVKDGDVVTAITLNLPGGLPVKIIASCDNVFALRKLPADGDDDTRVAMLTQQRGMNFARVRNDEFRQELGPVLINPTLPGIWDIYQKSLAAGRAKNEE